MANNEKPASIVLETKDPEVLLTIAMHKKPNTPYIAIDATIPFFYQDIWSSGLSVLALAYELGWPSTVSLVSTASSVSS